MRWKEFVMAQSSEPLTPLVINQQRLNSLLEDLGDEVVQRLFIIYQGEVGEKITLISRHLDREEYAAVECESHALKSASTNLGLDQVGQVMAEMEQAAMAQDHQRAQLSLHKALKYSEMINKMKSLG